MSDREQEIYYIKLGLIEELRESLNGNSRNNLGQLEFSLRNTFLDIEELNNELEEIRLSKNEA